MNAPCVCACQWVFSQVKGRKGQEEGFHWAYHKVGNKELSRGEKSLSRDFSEVKDNQGWRP